MRALTYFTPQNDRIDIHNGWLGTERVYYNGELKSKTSTLLGGTHRFYATEGGMNTEYTIIVSCKVTRGICFDIYRNNTPVLLS